MTTKQRLVISFAVLVAVSLFVVSYFSGADDRNDISVSGNPAIDALIPSRGAEVQQQQKVGIDFANGWTGNQLIIGPVVIPDGQLRVVDALGEITFQPDEGKALTQLPGESVCAQMQYWELLNPNDIKTFDWCFTVS